VLGRRLPLHPHVPADAAECRGGHIVNTSSVNGFWASIGPGVPHTAYSAAKFAVKGFTEALITDLRINATHIKCSVVMPGHVGTSIPINSRKIQSGNQSDAMAATQLAQARVRIASIGRDVSDLSDEDVRKIVDERERRFRKDAPTTAAQATTIILDWVARACRKRISLPTNSSIWFGRLGRLTTPFGNVLFEPDIFEQGACHGAQSFAARCERHCAGFRALPLRCSDRVVSHVAGGWPSRRRRACEPIA
jgi:hypothetical protein